MPITSLYAGLLALWFLLLSLRVIQRRGAQQINLGDGGDAAMLRRIRGHANFAEYVPLVLVLLGLLESAHWPAWLLHLIGAALLAGRVLHGLALSFSEHFMFGRVAGTLLTLLSLGIAAVLCIAQSVLALPA